MLPSKIKMKKFTEVNYVNPEEIKMELFNAPRESEVEEDCRRFIVNRLANGFRKDPFTLECFTGWVCKYTPDWLRTFGLRHHRVMCSEHDIAIYFAYRISKYGWRTIHNPKDSTVYVVLQNEIELIRLLTISTFHMKGNGASHTPEQYLGQKPLYCNFG